MLASHTQQLAEVRLDPELWRLHPRAIESLAEMEAYIDRALEEQHRGVSLRS